MSLETSPRLGLPFLQEGQAQKHLTLNESLLGLDWRVQARFLSRTLNIEPTTPSDGDMYLLPAGASGSAWASHAAQTVVGYYDGYWEALPFPVGAVAFVADENRYVVLTASGWVLHDSLIQSVQNAQFIGLNATADTSNPLIVRGPSSLLTAVEPASGGSGDSRLVINKTATANVASLSFKTNYVTHAEWGLLGNDNLTLQVSADGSAFLNALSVRTDTGHISIGHNAASSAVVNIRKDQNTGSLINLSNQDTNASANTGVRLDTQSGNYAIMQTYGSGTTYFTCNTNMIIGVSGAKHLRFRTDTVDRWIVEYSTGALRPATDNAYNLGSNSYRVATIYAATGTINTSDARDKQKLADIDPSQAARLVDAVLPVFYRWNIGGYSVTTPPETLSEDEANAFVPDVISRPGVRTHAGFLAQDIKAALDQEALDFGVWGLDDASDSQSRQWLRPDQLIPILWAALKDTRARLAILEGAQA